MNDRIVLLLFIVLLYTVVSLLWSKNENGTVSSFVIRDNNVNDKKLHAFPLPVNMPTNNGQISLCPKDLTAYVLLDNNKATICKRGFSFTSPIGRLGNALVVISNLLYVAEKTSSIVLLPEDRASLNNLIDTNTSILHNFGYEYDTCNKITIKDNFFGSPSKYFMGAFIPNNTLLETSRLLKSYVRPRMSKVIGDDTLVIHIRSGDIMVGNGAHPGYVQPPLAFYQKIIIKNNFTSIVIVCEDHNNPTIDALAKWSNIATFSAGTIKEDIATIIGASYLVVSHGTFSPMLSLLSETVKNVYVPCVPNCFMGRSPRENLPFAAEYYFFPNFTKSGEWKNTNAQRELMLSYPMQNILSNDKPAELIFEPIYAHRPATSVAPVTTASP